ncbi:MAG: hypothetical protein ACP5EK_03800 [Thermoplasmatota archaeon]
MKAAGGVLLAGVLLVSALAGCLEGDGDEGLPREIQMEGWYISVTYAGEDNSTRIKVDSDPDVTDTDGDGLTDFEEWRLGTNPRAADTDGDGLTDFEEVRLGTDPSSWVHDHDQDHFNDYHEIRYYESRNISHETILQFLQNEDVDGDGVRDGVDIDPLSDLRVRIRIASLHVTTTDLDPDDILEIQFTVTTDGESLTLPGTPMAVIVGENSSVNLTFDLNLDDQGIPGEYNNSLSVSVIDQDTKLSETKPLDPDGLPSMDIVRITGKGSFSNSQFDIRTDCRTYHLAGPDAVIRFHIEDISQPWS